MRISSYVFFGGRSTTTSPPVTAPDTSRDDLDVLMDTLARSNKKRDETEKRIKEPPPVETPKVPIQVGKNTTINAPVRNSKDSLNIANQKLKELPFEEALAKAEEAAAKMPYVSAVTRKKYFIAGEKRAALVLKPKKWGRSN